jgi:hypothetical protein
LWAVVDDGAKIVEGEFAFETQFYPFGEALGRLTFEDDRNVLARAIELIEGCGGV